MDASGELAEFADIEEEVEEEVAPEIAEVVKKIEAGERPTIDDVVAGLPPARPWARLGARVVDMAMYSTLLLTIIDKTSIDMYSDSWPYVRTVALFGIILIEAGMLVLAGTTPGKGLFGIHVRRKSDGRRLEIGSALGRTLMVWILGMGFGQLILLPFTMGLSLFFLRRDGVALWDRRRDVRLKSAGTNTFRLIVAGMLVASWLSLAAMVGAEVFIEKVKSGEIELSEPMRAQLEAQGIDLGGSSVEVEKESAPSE